MCTWHWPQGIYCYRILIWKKKSPSIEDDDASYGTEHHSKFKYHPMIFLRFFKAKISRKTSRKQKVLMMRIAVLQFLWEKIGSNVHYFSGTKKKRWKVWKSAEQMLKSLFDFHAISMTRIFILKLIFKVWKVRVVCPRSWFVFYSRKSP